MFSSKEFSSVDVYFKFDDVHAFPVVTLTPQEAWSIAFMPGFSGKIVKMVPNYELSEVSQEEN